MKNLLNYVTEKSRCDYEIMKKKKKKKKNLLNFVTEKSRCDYEILKNEKSVKLYVVVIMKLCKWKNLLN